MAKLTLSNVSNFADNSTAVTTTTANNDAIEAAIENTLSRDGTSPNTMGANLDMNSNRILNLPAPVNATEPITKAYGDEYYGNPQEGAETAQAAAEAARDAALAAQAATELAETNAETAATAAQTAQAATEAALAAYTLGDLANVDTTGATSGDGLVFDGTQWEPGPAGGGMFKGNNGTVGSRSGDIFRVNGQTLTLDATIAATENASAAGPLTINTGVTLTVEAGGTLVVL